MKKVIAAAGIAAVALTLSACGSGESEPAPTVTVTAEPEPARVETHEVEVTPQACLDALDLADESFSTISEIMAAIQVLDAAEVERRRLSYELHDDLAAFIYNRLKRRPMVLPVVVEV